MQFIALAQLTALRTETLQCKGCRYIIVDLLHAARETTQLYDK